MNNNLKPYEEYKDTEYDWLGSVPKHWKEQTVRSVTKLSNERNGDRDDLELLSVYREYGVIKKSSRNDNHNVESQDLSNYKFVDSGYLVLNKMKMWQGSLGVSKYKGIVSPAYIVCKIIGDINHEYIHYLLRSAKFKTVYNRISYGVRVGQWDMRYDDFKNIRLYLPPVTEQNKIVQYLDHQLAEINKFIKAKKNLINLLKEQKQAVIDEAMTKGINPDVKMKHSDIKWLGDIPEHWEYNKIKRFAKISPSKTEKFKKYSLEDEVVFLPMDKISNYGDIDNTERRPIHTVKEGFTYFEKNDVVVAKITPCFENGKGACLDNLDTQIGFGTTELVVLRANEKMLPKYLYFITRTSYFRKFGAEVMTGAAGQKRVPSDFISNFSIGVPDTNEQSTIIEYIYSQIKKIDNSITVTQKQIDLILEYRTSLISDVVTGKVNVQNIELNYRKENYLNIEDLEEDTIELEEVLEAEECEV